MQKFVQSLGRYWHFPRICHKFAMLPRLETHILLQIMREEYVSGMQHTTRSHGYFLRPEMSDHDCDIYTSDDPEHWSVDMLNPHATERYIEVIHQKYFDRFSEHFGKTIKGFFYDEPKASARPWSTDFLERFRKHKGYDLREFMVPLMVDYQMEGVCFNNSLRPFNIKKVLIDYNDMWTNFLAESFYKPLQQWCKSHSVMCTGHPVGDNGITGVFSTGGDYFKNMSFSDMPGVDVIFNDIEPGRSQNCGKVTGSRANTTGKVRAASELFAAFGHLPTGRILNISDNLKDWSEYEFPTYTGFMKYTTEFEWSSSCSEALLSLQNLHSAATIYLNGNRTADCIFAPYSVQITGLRKGKNTLHIDVLNTFANSVFGSSDRIEELAAKGVFKGTYAPIYSKVDTKRLVSGLLGPVILQPLQ